MTQETKFLQALKDIFVGATIEGESGYINLMRIKARYFERGVFPRLMQDIDAAVAPFPAFREELFDKLYDFFHRYFSESGSIYFRYTPLHERVYEKVYTDERDVALFYKTHMLYYVKTDRLFHSMDVVVDGLPFHFDVHALEHKRANEKRALVFEFQARRPDNVLVLAVSYSENGRKTKLDEMARAVRRTGVRVEEETLERAMRLFERQSEVDFFINKDARAFLRQQFDLWLFQYVFEPEGRSQTLWSERRIRQLQVLKDTAYKIIDFIAQFEDELVRIWNKPKFVRDSHYIVTLERVAAQGEAGQALLARFLAHPGIAVQIEEWRGLGMLDADQTLRVSENPQGLAQLDERTQFLPLDTRHFADLEGALAALFDHLDDALDGWLIRSDNYQALATIAPKLHRRVKCIYIDPPYNAEGSEILYVNEFRSSTWLTMIENRLEAVSFLLTEENPALAIAIDDFEMTKLRELLRSILPYDVNTIVINHHPQGSPKANVSRTHEYLLLGTLNGSDFVKVPRSKGKSDERPFMRTGTGENNFRVGRPNSFYALLIDPTTATIKGVESSPKSQDYPTSPTSEGYIRVYPLDGSGNERVWRKTYVSALRALEKGDIFSRASNNGFNIYEKTYIDRVKPTTNWFSSKYNAGTHGTALLTALFGQMGTFLYPKSLHSVLDIIDAVTYDDQEALVLDYFAGSGTTAHAVINLNRNDNGERKYILIEMADYFDTVILPRVKKVAFSDQWRDGAAQSGGRGISHFVKYFTLEQYEDVLRRAVYGDAEPLFIQADPYSQYVFLRDLKLLDNAETGEKVMTIDPAADAVHVHLERLYRDVDVAETLSCVTGQRIRRLLPDEVEFEDGQRMSLLDPPWDVVKPLVWW
ncbi:MAG: site-specific DNA-methyltransferase [Anaerolineae bacterium]